MGTGSLRLLVCGSRDWALIPPIERAILAAKPLVVIEGCARGADTIAENIAGDNHIPLMHFPANWDRDGKAAGPLRNTAMLERGKPDLVLAFTPNITASKGTRNMVTQAKGKGVPILLYDGSLWSIDFGASQSTAVMDAINAIFCSCDPSDLINLEHVELGA